MTGLTLSVAFALGVSLAAVADEAPHPTNVLIYTPLPPAPATPKTYHAVEVSQGRYLLRNPPSHLSAYVSANQARYTGDGDVLAAIDLVSLRVDGETVDIASNGNSYPMYGDVSLFHTNLTEHYYNTPDGLYENIIIEERVTPRDTKQVALTFEVAGNVTPTKRGQAVQMATATALPMVLIFTYLAADAAGKSLPVKTEVDGTRYTVTVNTEGAAFPVEIDGH